MKDASREFLKHSLKKQKQKGITFCVFNYHIMCVQERLVTWIECVVYMLYWCDVPATWNQHIDSFAEQEVNGRSWLFILHNTPNINPHMTTFNRMCFD